MNIHSYQGKPAFFMAVFQRFPSHIPKKYIDVQRYASSHLKHPEGTSVGLSSAAEALNIPIKLKLHNAFNDAFYTAEVFKKFRNAHIKPDIYDLHRERRSARDGNKKAAGDVDTNRLIEQFEKMYHRKMTSEEQTIIKLAYKMGNTSQFRMGQTDLKL